MDKESRSIDITIFRRPAIWMILFGLLHTVGYTSEAMPFINDDDELVITLRKTLIQSLQITKS